MCKLIRAKSDVLALVLRTEYVNRVGVPPKPEEKEDKALRILMMDAR